MEFLAQLHPKIVHFPIALLSTYVLLEIIGVVFKRDFFSKTAHLILLLGVLGALAAVLTGNQAEDVAHLWLKQGANINVNAIENHSTYANITLWFFAALLVLRTFAVLKKKFTGYIKYAFVVLAIIGFLFIYQTGKLGGKLVYDYGTGTQLKKMEIKK